MRLDGLSYMVTRLSQRAADGMLKDGSEPQRQTAAEDEQSGGQCAGRLGRWAVEVGGPPL